MIGQPITVATLIAVGGTPTDPGGISGALFDHTDLLIQTYPTPVRDDVGRYHQDVPTTDLTTEGRYRFIWTTTGTAAGVVVQSFDVYDPLGVDTWPTRVQVAKYVPNRLLVADESSDVPAADFGPLTTPTADQADDHIASAVAWVTAKCGAVVEALWASAREVAAVRAAGMIELSYPVRDGDINTAEQLLAQADAWVAALCEANEDLVVPDDGDTGDTAGHVLPRWSFPLAPSWGDEMIWS